LYWGFEQVLGYSKPHTFSKFIGEENEMHLLILPRPLRLCTKGQKSERNFVSKGKRGKEES